MLKDRFEIHDMTAKVVKYPQKYNLDIFHVIHPLLRRIPLGVLTLLNSICPISPAFILILKKTE